MTEEERRGEGGEGGRRGEIMFWLDTVGTVRRDRQNMFTTMLTTLSPSHPHLTGEIIQLSTKCDFDRQRGREQQERERREESFGSVTCNLDWSGGRREVVDTEDLPHIRQVS